ncbi:hypothetical protein HG531_005802 [Fusarium graminearum]|nr:hypothetical protein HG531_005802 [Fusarium graminearum]
MIPPASQRRPHLLINNLFNLGLALLSFLIAHKSYHTRPQRPRLLQLIHARHTHHTNTQPSLFESPADSYFFQVLAFILRNGRELSAKVAQFGGRRMPSAHRTVVDTACCQKTHAEHTSIRQTVHTSSLEAIEQRLVSKLIVLYAKVAVRHDSIQRLSRLAQDHLCKRRKGLNRITANTNISYKTQISQPSQLSNSSEHLFRRNKLDIVGINKIKIRGSQSFKTATHAVVDPGRRIVKLVACDAPSLCDNKITLARWWRCQFSQGVTEENLGGAVVGGCVEGEDVVGESAAYDIGVGHVLRVGVVLHVEGGCAEDERREDL